MTLRIGLLALSGVRAVDPELLRLGLSLPGVSRRVREIAALPSLGLLSIASVTPPGHTLHYMECPDGRLPAAALECDLVAISTLTAQARRAYALADHLRRQGVAVAIGGLHATACPEEAREHADHVVVGEGETLWPLVVNAVARNESGRIWRADDAAPVDLAALPPPRFDLLDPRRYHRLTVQTSRGCPWRCAFCASSPTFGRPYRKRPLDLILRDIAGIKALHPRPFIEFADDNTFVDKAWGSALCDRLAGQGVRWFAETDISVADAPALLRRLRPAGCRQLLIGLESPDQAALLGLEAAADFKARRWAGYREAVRAIQANGVAVNGCFILGLDEHTPATAGRILAFATELGLFDVQVTVLTPFPGTPLHDRLAAEGRLLQPGNWDACTLFDITMQPAGMTPQELRESLNWLIRRLYSASNVQQRRRAFRLQRLPRFMEEQPLCPR